MTDGWESIYVLKQVKWKENKAKSKRQCSQMGNGTENLKGGKVRVTIKATKKRPVVYPAVKYELDKKVKIMWVASTEDMLLRYRLPPHKHDT